MVPAVPMVPAAPAVLAVSAEPWAGPVATQRSLAARFAAVNQSILALDMAIDALSANLAYISSLSQTLHLLNLRVEFFEQQVARLEHGGSTADKLTAEAVLDNLLVEFSFLMKELQQFELRVGPSLQPPTETAPPVEKAHVDEVVTLKPIRCRLKRIRKHKLRFVLKKSYYRLPTVPGSTSRRNSRKSPFRSPFKLSPTRRSPVRPPHETPTRPAQLATPTTSPLHMRVKHHQSLPSFALPPPTTPAQPRVLRQTVAAHLKHHMSVDTGLYQFPGKPRSIHSVNVKESQFIDEDSAEDLEEVPVGSAMAGSATAHGPVDGIVDYAEVDGNIDEYESTDSEEEYDVSYLVSKARLTSTLPRLPSAAPPPHSAVPRLPTPPPRQPSQSQLTRLMRQPAPPKRYGPNPLWILARTAVAPVLALPEDPFRDPPRTPRPRTSPLHNVRSKYHIGASERETDPWADLKHMFAPSTWIETFDDASRPTADIGRPLAAHLPRAAARAEARQAAPQDHLLPRPPRVARFGPSSHARGASLTITRGASRRYVDGVEQTGLYMQPPVLLEVARDWLAEALETDLVA